jgi:hypothetical protein
MKNESTSSELRVLQALRHKISSRPYKHLMAMIQAAAKLNSSTELGACMRWESDFFGETRRKARSFSGFYAGEVKVTQFYLCEAPASRRFDFVTFAENLSAILAPCHLTWPRFLGEDVDTIHE